MDSMLAFNKKKGAYKTFLLAWKRLEIENYLLSDTMLINQGKADDVKELIAAKYHANLLTGNNEGLENLDVKPILKHLYLKDGYTTLGTHEEGVDYTKLKNIISEIPATEISNDIAAMFNFIKTKMQASK